MRHSRYSGIRLLCLALSVIFLTALLMACSANPVMTNSQMRDFVYNNFGITVRTRIVTLSNGAVTYEWISGELSSQHKKLINDSAKSKFQVTVLRNPTVKYNCHSYAWYSNSSSKTGIVLIIIFHPTATGLIPRWYTIRRPDCSYPSGD